MAGPVEPYCLVLGGGGAKGIYHVGVWKALREMAIPVNAFIGCSIGAVVSGYLAQGDDQLMNEIAARIGIDYVLKVPERLVQSGEFRITSDSLPELKELSRDTWVNKGLNTAPLRDRLHGDIDEAKLRTSGNDLGVVTFNVSEMKPREVFIEEMEKGSVADYLLASSAFPGFQMPRIGGDRFVDGGVFDNIPYAMALKRGYRKIIAVEVAGPGITRKPHIQNTQTVYIKNSINMGGVFDFDRRFLDRYMLLGYLDTLRTFGRLHGHSYFVTPDDEMEERFRLFLDTERGRQTLERATGARKEIVPDAPWGVRTLFPQASRHDKRLLVTLLDCAALIVGAERVRQYSYQELMSEIDRLRASIDRRVGWVLRSSEGLASARRLRWLRGIIRRSVRMKRYGRPPYYYNCLITQLVKRRPSRLLRRAIVAFSPAMSAGLFLLEVLDEFRATIPGTVAPGQ
jgi:NTE family protein